MGVPKVMVEGAVDSGRLAATGTVKTYGKIKNIEVTMNSQNTFFSVSSTINDIFEGKKNIFLSVFPSSWQHPSSCPFFYGYLPNEDVDI